MPLALAILLASVWIIPVQAASSDQYWANSNLRRDLEQEQTQIQAECSRGHADMDRCVRALDSIRARIRATDR